MDLLYGTYRSNGLSCGSVPVLTNNVALPEVVGDVGFYVPYGDEKVTAEAIKEALNSNRGKEAREKIKNMFGVHSRKRADENN